MANTPNYNLKKVEYTEIADIPGHFNANFDTIDTVMKNNADAAIAAEDNAKSYASELIGTLSNLLTTAKNNIVAAVNEIFGKVEDVEDDLIAHKADNVPYHVRTATVVVAASDSKYKQYADYICTGTADQNVIIDALNALPTPQGGKVLLLDGNYYFDNFIYYKSKKNIVISGVGSATKIQVDNIAYGLALDMDNTGTGAIENLSVISTVGCEYLVRIRDAKVARFSNIVVLGNSGGYGIYTYSASEDLIIENCNVQNCATYGIFVHGNNSKIINCTIMNNGVGIAIHGTANNVIIDGCHISGNTTQISDSGTNTILGANYIEGAI